MAKLKIDLPELFAFSTTLKLRITDINYGSHLGNDALLSLLHEARMRFLNSYNCSELDCLGRGLIMRSIQLEYKAQAVYGDELTFYAAVSELERTGFELLFKVVNQHGTEVARAANGMVFFDYEKGKVCRTPDSFTAVFKLES